MTTTTTTTSSIDKTRKDTARQMNTDLPTDGRDRVIIEAIKPCIDGGRFPAKRVVGEAVVVTADAFTDGHDRIRCQLSWRHESENQWHTAAMEPLVNDRWQGRFTVNQLGRYQYRLDAWVDHFGSWCRDTEKKFDADQDVSVDLLTGAALIGAAAANAAEGHARRELELAAELVGDTSEDIAERVDTALDPRILELVQRHEARPSVTTAPEQPLEIQVDPKKAAFSAWYEMFPRSASPDPDRHGTFKDVQNLLPHIAEMGFDVLYLPPIHPIGKRFRKGPNNTLKAGPKDPGVPWAIGASEGGHKSIHPELGTLEDFRSLVKAAAEHGIDIALDIAYQCSPDHPYVREHPEWFRQRADGTIQYAENPPKKYQDIYPFDFETENWRELWLELKSIIDYWIEQGVTIFRVDNPHTKAFPFWEWMIGEIKREHPETIFLSEAFTRPKVMYRLAKLGFTQSYTYFAWRNRPREIEQYFTELTQTDAVEFFRPNAWPNTPDILNEYLQHGGRAASLIRLILAATLTANYGIYGPPFELAEVTPREPGSEEYLDSEKYQRRVWNHDAPHSLKPLIARINRIRQQNPALQQNRTLRFHHSDNPAIACYSKTSPDMRNVVLCTVTTNPYDVEAGIVRLDLQQLGIAEDERYQVHDLLTDSRYHWRGADNYVMLDPGIMPAHVFVVRRYERTEQDFEYFL